MKQMGKSKQFTSNTPLSGCARLATKLIMINEAQPLRQGTQFDIQAQVIHDKQISIAAAIHNTDDSNRVLRQTYADLLLIDVDFTGTKSTALIGMAKKSQPHINIILLATTIDSKHLVQSIAAGACGYLSKADTTLNLVPHLHDFVHDRKPPFCNEAIQQILTVLKKNQSYFGDSPLLTLRETEILTAFAKGYSYKATARELSISTNTVPSHIKNIYRKLGVHSRSEAVFKALQKGLIQLG